MIRSQTPEIWQLPWHRWEFLQNYSNLEVSFSPLQTLSTPKLCSSNAIRSASLKILVVLGDATGIDIQKDRHSFEQSGAQVEVLTEPKRKDLIAKLQDHSYDLLFFAGHSRTDKGVGFIDLNPTDSLTLEELRSTLKQAIHKGLQLAIFNSCDGLGLVKALEQLQIPHLIVMREPVPDAIAQSFLKVFLQKFSSGVVFHLAAREAREELTKFEDHFPCASWLPLIWQSPSAAPLRWKQPVNQPIAVNPVWFQRASLQLIWRYFRVPVAIGLASAAAVIGLRSSGLLQFSELAAFDHLMRLRPQNEGADPNLLIIEITDTDIQIQHQNKEQMQRVRTTAQHQGEAVPVSLSDQSLEKILDKLSKPEYRPRVIGLDIYRDFPVASTQPKLTASLKNLPTFVICKAENLWKSGIPAIDPPPEMPIDRVGFSDFQTDDDNTLRRHWLSMYPLERTSESRCTSNHSFSVQVAFSYLRQQGIIAELIRQGKYDGLKLGGRNYSVLRSSSGGYQNLPFSGNQIMLNSRATPEIATHISLSQFLTNQINPDYTKDKIVLIGTVKTGGSDYWQVPSWFSSTEQMSGVVVQAHMISQLVNAALPGEQRPLIWVWTPWGDSLWILAWTTVGGMVVWSISTQNRPREHLLLRLMLSIILFGGALYGVSFGILLNGGWMPLVPAAMGIFLSGSVTSAYLIHQNRKSRLVITQPSP